MAIITGDGSSNTLVGSGSSDQLFGLGGADTLSGLAGSDALFGGVGFDRLSGGSGADTLVGGLGRDVLTGGKGPDVFVFDDKDTGDVSSGQADVITDFGANDIIDLRAVSILSYDWYTDQDPGRAEFSIWQAGTSTFITWNTYGGMHDIELRGYSGDVYDVYGQVRWYDDDYSGTTNTTASIAAGQFRSGTLEVVDDTDWFKIDLVAGKVYDFAAEGKEDGFGTARNPTVTLYDAHGDYVDDDFGYGKFPYLADQSGTYYLAVSGGDSAGSYRLHVTSKAYADDHGDDLDNATHLPAGQARTGSIELRDDVDVFSITVEEGKTYQIDVTSRANAQHPLDDPYVEIVNQYWDEITYDDDSGAGLNARATFTATEDATYYIGVFDSTGLGWGAYRIAATETDALV